MDITILIERDDRRDYTSVKSEATRIDGVHRTRWYGERPNDRRDIRTYYSLVHVATGRALNKVPLTEGECDQLIHELYECPIEWEKIDSDPDKEWPGKPYFTGNLTQTARRLAGDTGAR